MISACLLKRPSFLFILLFSFGLLTFSQVPTSAQSALAPGIKTDRAVYPEPALPVLPAAGGKFNDPTFGTQIMRATDAVECPAPGCGTYYSHWPTFNSDNSFILVRKGDNGAALVKPFDPVNFTTGPGHQPGQAQVPGSGSVSINFESAIWHPTNPRLIYCFPFYYDGGMKLFTYDVVSRQYTLVKDFGSLGTSKDFLHQMSMSKDGDVFAWSQMREGSGGDPVAYIVWRKSTDTVLYHVTVQTGLINEVRIDKSGKFLAIPFNGTQPDGRRFGMLNMETGVTDYGYWNPTDSPTGHGDNGSGFNAGWDNWACGINRHALSNIHSTQVVFRFIDANGNTDWSNDFHGSLLADDESWLTIGTFDDPNLNSLPDRGIFEDEIFQVKLDGSGQFRRLLHTRTAVDLQTPTTGYWAMPKPTISRDGRFIAYTSNWEKSGRYDLFIAKVEPAGGSAQPTSPGLVSSAQVKALSLSAGSSVTEAQINQLVASIEQAYAAFSTEAGRFVAPTQMEMGLRAALYFSRAAAALAAAGGNSTGVQNRLQIAASYLTQVQSLMSGSVTENADAMAHAVSGSSFTIGLADTRSNASFATTVAPNSIGTIFGDPNLSPLSTKTKSAAPAANGPFPFELEGVSITIGGRSAQLITVSPSRLTFTVPAGLPAGEAEVIVTTQDGYVSRGTTTIAALAPGLFTRSDDGRGAGLILDLATYAGGSFDVTSPLNLSSDKRTRLMIFATGISNGAANTNTSNDVTTAGGKLLNYAESVTVSARTSDGRTFALPVEYAGAQGRLPGLDQVNVVLVPELKGTGTVELTVAVAGTQSNKVTISIR